MNARLRVSSAPAAYSACNMKGKPVFARFTIVSLTTIVFGLVLATIVAEAGRERRWQNDRVVDCRIDEGVICGGKRL